MKPFLAVASYLLVALYAGGAFAQSPQPLDILGIQLGMPADKATQIVNSHVAELSAQNVKMQVQPARISYDVLPAPMDWAVQAAASGNGTVPSETIIVVFTMPPNSPAVVEVHRWLGYRQNMPAKDTMLASLVAKYGPESFRQGDGNDISHRWLFQNGQQQFFQSPFASLGSASLQSRVRPLPWP